MPPYQSVHMRVCSYGEGYGTCTGCAYGDMWGGHCGIRQGWVYQDHYLFPGLTFWAWAWGWVDAVS